MSSLDYLDLCRLCLVKDRVGISIFEDEGDARQVFLKIASCLPVKVSREDKLPKKICDDCMYKLELFYQFWNTTANAEKQLLQWLDDVDMQDKQGYVTEVLNPSLMKQEQQASENRLDENVLQVGTHQNNMGMGMMDNMGLGMPIIISTTNQPMTSVSMDTSGSSVQTIQAVPGTSTQSTHDQISQNQVTNVHHNVDEDSDDDEENESDDECDADDGLPVKEENEDDPNNRTVEPTTFVNVSLPCDEAGPSGLQQQKITEMPEMAMPQIANADNKTGDGGTFGGLSGMLRQILSPSPESADIGLAGCCNYLQPSVFMNHPTMMPTSLQMSPTLSHLSVLYPEQPVLHEHVQILGESYSCPNCGLEFRSILKLNYHIKTSHPQREEIDNRPMNIVPSGGNIDNNNINNQPRYTCQICSRTFLAQSHLRMHEVTHTSPITSSISPMNNVTSTSYVQTTINNEKTFTCNQCQATFRYRTLLERHKKLHETGQDKPYSCPKCFMRFETRNLYNHHAKTHKTNSDCRAVGTIAPTAIIPATPINIMSTQSGLLTTNLTPSYPCDSCTKEFSTPELLNSHKSVHRLRPLVCDVCGKGFTHRKYYVVHQRIHTGERPYLCAMCGKSFTQASTLTVHRRYHTGERPYTCTLCGKGFVTRTIMLNHMKKH